MDNQTIININVGGEDEKKDLIGKIKSLSRIEKKASTKIKRYELLLSKQRENKNTDPLIKKGLKLANVSDQNVKGRIQ